MVEHGICIGGVERYVRYGNIACNHVFHYNLFHTESPRWLILKGKEEKATNILRRIYTSSKEALFQLTETKSVLSSESKSEWKLLLQPGIRKAVIIGVCIAVWTVYGCECVLYYGPSIFENAGLSGGDSLFYQFLVGW
jgi:hypothetical protein